MNYFFISSIRKYIFKYLTANKKTSFKKTSVSISNSWSTGDYSKFVYLIKYEGFDLRDRCHWFIDYREAVEYYKDLKNKYQDTEFIWYETKEIRSFEGTRYETRRVRH